MKIVFLALLNSGLVVLFFYLLRQRNLFSYHHGGRVWLTFLAVGVITLMAEFTSIFYAPAKAFRFYTGVDLPLPQRHLTKKGIADHPWNG